MNAPSRPGTLVLGADLTGIVDVSHSQAVQFVVGGLPSGNGYTITLTGTTEEGFPCQGGTAVMLGSFTETVPNGDNVDLPRMLFATGTYDALQIQVEGNFSWVATVEISFLTPSCHAGPGGSFIPGTQTPADAATSAAEAGAP